MERHSRLFRSVIPLVAFLLLLTLACSLSPSLPTGQGSGNTAASGAGTTRRDPIPMGTRVIIPGWEIEAREFLRGDAALAVINTSSWQADALPPGQEYALAKFFVRCTSLDSNYHDLGISELFITGNQNVAYGDTMDGWPQPEFLFEDMYTAEAVEGWIDAIIPTDEQNIMAVLDVDEGDTRTTRFLALEPGASISLPSELSNLTPNGLGVTPAAPAALGQQVISTDWEVTLLNVIRGSEAETILAQGNANYSPPAAGMEYLLLQVRLRYISPDEQPAWVGGNDFYAVDENGYGFQDEWIYLPGESDRVWLAGMVLPGATLEGWVAVNVLSGTDSPVIAFAPVDSEDQRYLAIK